MSYPELEPERYELFAGPAYNFAVGRRDFLRGLGGGLAVVVCAGSAIAQQQGESGGGRRRGGPGSGPAAREISAWVHIAEDGAVTLYSGKAEVGQNVRTSLALSVADELRVPLASVRTVVGDTELTPYDAGTFGSQSSPRMMPQLRRAAAAARELLVRSAAEQWNADAAALVAAGGNVTDPKSKRSATYGELAKGRKLTSQIAEDVRITPASEWKIAGKPALKITGREIVTGRHRYSPDVKRPGMLHGKILRAPAFGAKVASLDTSKAAALPNVTVVKDGEFAGVCAPTAQAAEAAIAAFQAEWNTTPQPSEAELFELLKKTAGAGRGNPDSRGNIEQALAEAEQKLKATYTVAYIAHVPLEPRAAVAEWNGDKLTVWTGTQRPFGVRSELAEAFRIPESQVRVIVPDTGSGYGGKHTGEAAVEAARLAKAAGHPVKLVWTREEEFTWAYARPAGVIEITSGMRGGVLTAWEYHNYNSGGAALRTPYDVANQHHEFHSARSPLRQGSYRALAATANHFARETHMDEAARAAKMDPLEFRLKNLKDARLRAVLEAAAERFGWGKRSGGKGRGFGLAGGTEKGSYVAACVELAVENSGTPRIVRIVEAFECGAIINPDHLRNQVEGAMVQGLGGALFEALHFENGRILNPRLSKYRVPRFSDVPPIESVLLDRKDLPTVGAGETPIVAVAPAIGNAIFDATGERRRAMPLLGNGNGRGKPRS